MSFESQPIESKDKKVESFEKRRQQAYNGTEVLIWQKECSPDENEEGKCIQDWVDQYGPSYEILFKEVLARDPEFIDKWHDDMEERFRARDFFINELKKLDGTIEKAA